MCFAYGLEIFVFLHTLLELPKFIAQEIKVDDPLATLLRIRVCELLPAPAKILAGVTELFRIVLANLLERAPRVGKEVVHPLLQMLVVADVDNAFLQGRIQVVQALATRHVLRELSDAVHGMNEVLLRRRVVNERLQ